MPGRPVICEIDNVSKRFVVRKEKDLKDRLVNFRASNKHKDDFWALSGVSANLELGSTVGLVGHNGSGKSTLLKIIGGILPPSEGTVRRRGRLAALLELGAGFHGDLTGRDNVYLNASILGLTRKETAARFDDIVAFSGIEDFIDTQVKFYSSGMYVRLAFAVAVHVDPDLLLVDEVLAVGDEPFQRKCLEKIAEFQREGRAIVIVSHISSQVRSLCDRVIVLDHGVVQHDGDTAEGLDVLRAGFEASRKIELARVRDDDAGASSGPVRLRGLATLLNRDTESSNRPTLDIELSVDVNTAGTPWGASYTIVSSGGLVVYEFSSLSIAAKLPREAGTHTIQASIPDLNLGEGEYSLDVALIGLDGAPLPGERDSSTFAIEYDSQGSGLLRFQPEVRVVSS